MKWTYPRLRWLVTIVFALGTVGCGTLNRVAGRSLQSVFDSLLEQPDPTLVRDGAPSYLLAIDGFIARDPANPDLLRAGCYAYSTYATAFLSAEADAVRAGRLQERAREYGLRLLRRHAAFARAETGGMPQFEAALARFGRADVRDLYIGGSAWLGWIISKPDSMAALAELSKALAVMERVLALDESCADGGAHLVFGMYYAVQPAGAGQDLPRSRKHFERAMKLGGEQNLLPRVLFAEFYARATADARLFSETLDQVLAAPDTTVPRFRLMNAIARERATRLRQQKEEWF